MSARQGMVDDGAVRRTMLSTQSGMMMYARYTISWRGLDCSTYCILLWWWWLWGADDAYEERQGGTITTPRRELCEPWERVERENEGTHLRARPRQRREGGLVGWR